jgi:hypothetical protein
MLLRTAAPPPGCPRPIFEVAVRPLRNAGGCLTVRAPRPAGSVACAGVTKGAAQGPSPNFSFWVGSGQREHPCRCRRRPPGRDAAHGRDGRAGRPPSTFPPWPAVCVPQPCAGWLVTTRKRPPPSSLPRHLTPTTEVDPFNPYGILPCVVPVSACTIAQGCVSTTLNATVVVGPLRRPVAPPARRRAARWVSHRSRPPWAPARAATPRARAPQPTLRAAHPAEPPAPPQPTPIASAGGPYAVSSPFPKNVTLNGTASLCAYQPCTFRVRGKRPPPPRARARARAPSQLARVAPLPTATTWHSCA